MRTKLHKASGFRSARSQPSAWLFGLSWMLACGQDAMPLAPGATWTPPPTPGSAAVAPAAPPAAETTSDASALPPGDLGQIAAHLVSLARDTSYETTAVKREGTLVRVTLQRKDGQEPPVAVFLSPDGAELYESPLALADRTRQLQEDAALARCLIERHVRLFITRGAEASDRQLAEVGAFSDRFVIDCAVAPDNCAALGVTNFPTVKRGEHSETRVHKRDWLVQWAQCGRDRAVAPPAASQPPPGVAPPSLPAPRSPASGLPPVEAPPPPAAPPEDIGLRVAALYRLAHRTELDVLAAVREGPVVRVSLQRRNSRETPAVVFATPDGKTVFEAGVHVALRLEQLEDDRRFADCAAERGLRAYVRAGDEASQLQAAALGVFARRLVVDCAAAAEACEKAGVKTLPALVLGERTEVGARSRPWLETFTGCK